jgi:hypothetical protein
MGRHTSGRITINNFEKMENRIVICYKNGIAHGNPFSPGHVQDGCLFVIAYEVDELYLVIYF